MQPNEEGHLDHEEPGNAAPLFQGIFVVEPTFGAKILAFKDTVFF